MSTIGVVIGGKGDILQKALGEPKSLFKGFSNSVCGESNKPLPVSHPS